MNKKSSLMALFLLCLMFSSCQGKGNSEDVGAKTPIQAESKNCLEQMDKTLKVLEELEYVKKYESIRIECVRNNLLNIVYNNDGRDKNLLIQSSKNGDLKVVKDLLNIQNIDVNALDNLRHSALHNAIAFHHKEIITLLLSDQRIDLELRKHLVSPIFHWASFKGEVEAMKTMLEKYPHFLNERTWLDNETALHSAILGSKRNSIEFLLGYENIDVFAKNDEGYTPLEWAVHLKLKPETGIIKLLEDYLRKI